MVARRALLIFLSVFITEVAPSESRAACYCACVTATGSRCTVSVPDYACRRTGSSVCRDPLEQCTYDCSRHVARPLSCSPRRRCSVRE